MAIRQADLVHDFADGADVYKKMAAFIYQKNTNDITAEERFVGKTTILGAGYGMGWKKFQVQLLSFGVDVSEGFAKTIVNTYREAFPHIPALWREGDLCLEALTSENLVSTPFGKQPQAVSLLPGVGFDFPSKIPIKYRGLAKYIKIKNRYALGSVPL